MRYSRLWTGLALVILASFAILGYYGRETYWQAPPIPKRVVTTDGKVLMTEADIKDGQNVWQSMGGQEIGSVWGHGAYVAPDWTADWLHQEAVWLLDQWATRDHGQPYDKLDAERQAALRARLAGEMRTNTYNAQTGDLVISPIRAEAFRAVSAHYDALFGNNPDPALHELREAYAMPANSVPDPARRAKMNSFFFWATWSTTTNRPGQEITYTNNWPPEPLVGNRPTGQTVVWSVISFVLLLAGVGGLVWYYAAEHHRAAGEAEHPLPKTDPLLNALKPTPSMKATLKYFWVVALLIIVQIGLGVLTAHYGVEGTGLYGIPIAKWIPYVVTRTWHTQLGIYWIATAWLATG
ncbi:MAG: nitric oxide reductase large subunit, partial [Symbiobacteriaceae bacterium]|nr:nitric oxide reductase large subunit [Symbiobacteriaceae bacterium]